MHASPTKAQGVRPLQPSLKASTCGSREAHTNKQAMRDGQPYLVSQGVEDGHRVHIAYMTSGNIAVFDHDVRRHLDFVARAAAARGYEYLAATDHSASHGFGNDVQADELLQIVSLDIEIINQ
jgi:hypothetical protein